jgi:phosphate binding protein
MYRKMLFLLSAVMLISILLTACGGGQAVQIPTPTPQAEAPQPTEAMQEPTQAPEMTEEPQPTEAKPESMVSLPEVVAADYSDPIVAAGSSTVYPLTEALAVRWEGEGGGSVTIDSIGSGAGFERFCVAGETDISNASRPIKDSEVESCKAIGRTPVEFRVGTDALAVTVSTENDFLTDISLDELALAFSTAQKWSDIRPEWPAETILRYSPGTDSGTFDYFVEAVMDPYYVKSDADEGKGKEAILNAENIQFSEDDNILVQGVEGSPYAIGYFGFAYYNENKDLLKALSVNGVEPNEQTAEDNSYPLSRPLFIYSDPGVMQSKPQVAAFINFYLTNVNDEIINVGYFPASVEALDTAKQNWLDAQAAQVAMPEPEAEGIALPEVVAADYSDPIVAAGSSTVYPLTEALAVRWEGEGGGSVTIDSIGSGAGFERFCVAGETDISNASRPIKDSEVESCKAIGRTPVEFRVGTDALAVTVSTENDFLTDISLDELALAFSTAQKWSDIRPEWPAETILRYSPGTDSGTFDYFVEAVMDPYYVKSDADEGKGKEAILNAENIQFSEDDNILVQGVEGSPYAIGYFGFAYYNENKDLLKALSVNGVEPNEQTAEDNSYPLSRPLFIYSDPGVMQSKPQVAAFINFYLTNVNDEIINVGYFPASAEALDTAKQNWLDAMGQ